MIRTEVSRTTAVTFKTLKAAENRVARDAAWAAGFNTEDTVNTVEVSPRWDAEASRTVYDVQYAVYSVVAPQDVPEGAEVRVTGPYSGSAAYGYVGTVVGTHITTGRLVVEAVGGRRVVADNDDALVTALPEPVTDLHLEDGSCCDEGLGECPRCGGTTFHNGEERVCQDCPAPATAAQLGAAFTPAPFTEWDVRGLNEATDETLWVQGAGDLGAALDIWRAEIAKDEFACVQVWHNGSLYADVRDYDTCSVHRDAVFSKDGPCPVCVEEDDAAAQGRPCDACGALPREECRPGCIGLAAHEDDAQAGGWRDAHHADLQQHTVARLRALLERVTGPAVEEHGDLVRLTAEEIAALSTAIAVLEG